MDNISKIIADKILGNPLDEVNENKLQEWLSACPENQEIFERTRKGELARIIVKKENEQIGNRIAQNILKTIHEKKRRNRGLLLATISSAAALVAVTFLIYSNEGTPEFVEIEETVAEIAPQTVNDEIVLITANGNSINIEKSEALDSIIKQNSEDVKLTKIKNAIANNTIIVPLKKMFDMVLPDGTKVWLNSGSKLTFPAQFSDTLRRVELVGEAFFEVVRNTKAPFIVQTKMLETKVLGTKFMVTSYENQSKSEVALVEGRVNVSSAKSNRSSILKAGEGVSYDSKENSYKVTDINIDNVLNRKNAKFIFNDIALSEITTFLSNWYGVEFEFSDKSIENEVFYLKSTKYDSINEIMLLLKDTKKIDYKIEKNRILIKSLMPML